MTLKVTPVSVQERRGSITTNSKKIGWTSFIEKKRLYQELTVSKKSNINLHILPWALCWLASIGAGPENQKGHHYQHHNKIDKTSAENLTWPSPHHCTAASWPFRPRTLVPLHPHKSNVLLVCCLSLNISISKKKCCFQTWYVPYLRPPLLLPRLVEAGVEVAPEPGSDPSAQVLSWIEVQNNISEAPIMERPKQSILKS